MNRLSSVFGDSHCASQQHRAVLHTQSECGKAAAHSFGKSSTKIIRPCQLNRIPYYMIYIFGNHWGLKASVEAAQMVRGNQGDTRSSIL